MGPSLESLVLWFGKVSISEWYFVSLFQTFCFYLPIQYFVPFYVLLIILVLFLRLSVFQLSLLHEKAN